MEKDAYFFSHDANARHDPNICEMRAEWGMEGYGIYWCIIEMLREQEDFKLKLTHVNAIAFQSQCEKDAIKKFVNQCINDYDLFQSDGEYFWSISLLRRMQLKNLRSEKARKSAKIRWKNANAMRTQSKSMRTQCEPNAIKERKGKEKKERRNSIKIFKKKSSRKKYGEYKHVLLTPEQYDKLLKKWGQRKLDHMIKVLDEGIELKGYGYKNHHMALIQWARNEKNIPESEPTEYEIEDET